MSDQKPKVQWYRCDECDPPTNVYKLTVSPFDVPRLGLFLPPSTVVEPLFFGCGNWSIFEGDMHRMKPSHWAEIVDEEPVGIQFKFDWVKTCDRPPAEHGGVVWARGRELRIALFDGSKWREHAGCKEIEPPDWWASRWAELEGWESRWIAQSAPA